MQSSIFDINDYKAKKFIENYLHLEYMPSYFRVKDDKLYAVDSDGTKTLLCKASVTVVIDIFNISACIHLEDEYILVDGLAIDTFLTLKADTQLGTREWTAGAFDQIKL